MIRIQDKWFKKYIGSDVIRANVQILANKIQSDYNEMPLMLGVLNGSFIFAADLCRFVKKEMVFEFVRYASYDGLKQADTITEILPFNKDHIKGRQVLIVEDIVDSGNTIAYLESQLLKSGAAEVDCVTAFFKPKAYKFKKIPKYVAMEIEDDFVVGYGMDYNGFGRNLADLYVLNAEKAKKD